MQAAAGDAAQAVIAADAATTNAQLASGKNNSGGGAKRTSWVWNVFDETGVEKGKACCMLLKPNGETCGEKISTLGGPTGMKSHIMYRHPDDYIKMAPPSEKLNVQLDPQEKMNALPSKHRDEIHKAHARWLVKCKRPLSLPQDKEYHDLWNVAMTPPDHKKVLSDVLLLSGEGKQ